MWLFTHNTKHHKSSSPELPPSEFNPSYKFKLLSDASTYGYVLLESSQDIIYKLLFVSETEKALPEINKVTMTTKSIRDEITFQRRAGTISPKIIDTHKLTNTDAIAYVEQIKHHLDTTSAMSYLNKTTIAAIQTVLMKHPNLRLYVIKMERLRNYSLSELFMRQDIKTNFDNAYACVLKRVLQLFLDKECIHMDMHSENIFMSPCRPIDAICNCNLIDYGIMFDMSKQPSGMRMQPSGMSKLPSGMQMLPSGMLKQMSKQMSKKKQTPVQTKILSRYSSYMNSDYSNDVKEIHEKAVKLNDLYKLNPEVAIQVIHKILRIIVGVDLSNGGAPQCRDFINSIYGDQPFDIVTHPIFDWTLVDPGITAKLELLWNIIVTDYKKLKSIHARKRSTHTKKRSSKKTRHTRKVASI